MEEYATRFADLLEQIATKVRSLTVDRVAGAIRLAGLGILVLTLAVWAGVFLFLAVIGALEIPLTLPGALAVTGGSVAAIGGFLWWKRTRGKQ